MFFEVTRSKRNCSEYYQSLAVTRYMYVQWRSQEFDLGGYKSKPVVVESVFGKYEERLFSK